MFSCLSALESYLTATMTQTRLNNVMVFHVYKKFTDDIGLLKGK